MSGESIQATNVELKVLDDAELDEVTGGQFFFNREVIGVGIGQIDSEADVAVGIGQIFLDLGQPQPTNA